MYCHCKIELNGQPLGENKMSQPQNIHFGNKYPKIKKHIFPLTTTFSDFAYDLTLKIEASWVKKDVKPSLETWNVNDVLVYIWYIYSQIKKKKKKKEEYKQE